MKKVLSLLLSILFAATSLGLTFSAAADAEPIVITGAKLAEIGKLSDPEKTITYPAAAAEDGSLRLVFSKNSKVGKMQFAPKNYASEVDKNVYRFVKVRYKYHFSNPNENYQAMLREGYSGGSTNHFMFKLEKENDVWHEGIAEIAWGESKEEGVFTFHPVRESGTVYAGDVFYLDYIGFFASREEAEAFSLNDKTYTDPVLVEDKSTYWKQADTTKPAGETSTVSKKPNAEPVVLEAKNIIITPYRMTVSEKTEGDRKYLHIEADPSQEPNGRPKVDRFDIKDLDLEVYKYFKICYRTNLDPSFAMNLQSIRESSKNHKFYPDAADTWESVVLKLAADDGNLIQYHFWAFGDNAAEALSGYYTDVEYIAFFPTLEQATEFRKETSGSVRTGNDATAAGGKKEEIDIQHRDDVEIVAAGEPILLTDEAIGSIPYRLFKDLRKEDDFTYMHLEPDTAQEAVPKLDNFAMGVLLNSYKYLKIGYRTNWVDPEKPLLYAVQREYKKTYSIVPKQKDTWEDAIIQLDAPGDAEKLIQAHFWAFGDMPANALAGCYTDIRYIGFFTSLAEAQAYGTNGETAIEITTEEHTPYMKGYDNGDGSLSFKPAGNMTRAEACTLVARLAAGADDKVPEGGASAFTDVSGAWYTKYITYLEGLGYLSAYSGAFLPDQAITRAEFVELVFKLGLVRQTSEAIAFTDVPTSHPRFDTIRAAAAAGLVNGYDNGDGTNSFKPDNTITRAEVVTVINRALGRKLKELSIPSGYALTSFTDVDAAYWAYPQIAEATTAHEAYNTNSAKALSYEIWAVMKIREGEEAKAKEAEIEKLAEDRKNAILNAVSVTPEGGATYYVSSKNGNDDNDGLSPETAFATPTALNKVLFKPGDKALFERGSLFRGHFSAKANAYYGAYGEGEKPRFYGSPYNGAVDGSWTRVADNSNVWEYSEKFTSGDIGTIVFNGGEEVAIKHCSLTNNDGLENLKNNFEFWFDTSKMKVYLYLDKGDPSKLYNDIEFNDRGHIFSVKVNNVIFDNLCFMYGGSHGIGCGGVTNVHVQNCVFGYIGGAINSGARFGNGVEFWAPSQDCSVSDCYVYQVYDAGITFQMKGNSSATCTFNRIVFENNLIENCVYDIEYFLRQEGTEDDYIANTTIRGNILRKSGGWGLQRPDSGAAACIKGWDSENRSSNFVIENNILDCGVDMLIHIGTCAAQFLPIMRGNTYLQQKGGRFGRWYSTEIPFDSQLNYAMTIANCENTAELYALS